MLPKNWFIKILKIKCMYIGFIPNHHANTAICYYPSRTATLWIHTNNFHMKFASLRHAILRYTDIEAALITLTFPQFRESYFVFGSGTFVQISAKYIKVAARAVGHFKNALGSVSCASLLIKITKVTNTQNINPLFWNTIVLLSVGR